MASNLEAVRAAIDAAVTALDVSDCIQLPGKAFVPPRDVWAKVEIFWPQFGKMESSAADGVSGNALKGCYVRITVTGKFGCGLGEVTALADIIRAAFSRVQLGTAFFFAPGGPRDASDPKDKSSVKIIVDCPFEVREA